MGRQRYSYNNHKCKLCGRLTDNNFKVKPRRGKEFYICKYCENQIFGKAYKAEAIRRNTYQVSIQTEAKILSTSSTSEGS